MYNNNACDAWDKHNRICMLANMENLGCIFCGSLANLMRHKDYDKFICRECLKKFMGLD